MDNIDISITGSTLQFAPDSSPVAALAACAMRVQYAG
jgi:hypothetical protein